MKTKLKNTSKRKPAGQTRALAVAPCSASGTSDAEINQALHHVLLEKELDDLGAPKELCNGKLSPYGRLRRIAPVLLADKRRLNFIIETLNRVGTHGIGNVIRWGYPGLDRADIDAAMRGPNNQADR